MPSTPAVLVTGGAGFIAAHTIAHLLAQGHRVRTTARSLDREPEIRSQLARLGVETGDALSVVAADLLSDDGWAEAVSGCEYVLHVASPIPHGAPADEEDVIRPAREGTLRVLRAARDARVRRVVLMSAFHAIGFGWGRTDHVFTEADWSKLDGPGMDAYGRSKTLAERAAWEFMDAEGTMELAVLNPVAVLGPAVSAHASGGNALVQRILSGELRAFPDVWIPIVDVRDVAVAERLAMITPDAAGQRFLIGTGDGLKLAQIGSVLRDGLGAQASRVGTRNVPSWVIRLVARFNPTFRAVVADLGVVKKIDASLAQRVLGWTSRPIEQTVLDAAESMLILGLA
jgi:nucleoside-diphosphate-sugar epimerase